MPGIGRCLAAVCAAAFLSASAFGQTPPAAAHAPPAPTPAARPAATPSPASAADRAAGKALFEKVVVWLGGPKKIASVTDVQTKGELTARTPDGEATMHVESAIVFPDRLLQQIDSPYGRIGMVATPSGAFLMSPQATQDVPPAMRDELLRQIQRIPLFLARQGGDPKLQVASAGTARIGDVETTILDVRYDPIAVKWYVDPTTGRILRTSHVSTSPEGKAVEMVSDYSDFKDVSGFPVAHRLTITSNGEPDQTLVLEECRINAGVDPRLFERPPSPTPTPASVPPASPTP